MKFIKNAAAILFILIAFSHFIMAQSLPDRYMQLADDFRKNAQPDSALVYYEKASVELQKTADFEKLANAYNQMGVILTRQDKYEPAKMYLEKALQIGHTSLDSNHLTTAVTYISLGVVYAAEENFEQSLKFHYQALAIRILKLGEYSTEVATSYGNIGNVYFNSKNYDKAIEAHTKAMNIRERLFGPNGVEITQSYTNLGNAYREKKEYKTALDYFDKALQNKLIQRGWGHKELVRFYKNISDVYYLMGNKTLGDLHKARSESAALDIFTRPLVYQIPEMGKVQIKTGNPYKTIKDTTLRFDLYYPEDYTSKGPLPLVIFINLGSMDIPQWRVYQDWAKLVATRGMAAVVYQCRGNNLALSDTEDLISFLRNQSATLQLDPERIGIWACSANVPNGFTIAMQPNRDYLRCMVMYYGVQPANLPISRQDIPIQMIRAGLDAHIINNGIDNFLVKALQQDIPLEFINYLEGMHAFDIFNDCDESREIIVRTLDFMGKHLHKKPVPHRFILTNKNFLWMMQNGQSAKALAEFRKAVEYYKTDPSFNPFYNAVVRENAINGLGYSLLQDKRHSEAVKVFEVITEAYPASANAWESLSEAYETNGEQGKAKVAVMKAIELIDKDNTMNANLKLQVRESAEERLKRVQ